jgi:hypothetical protein
MGTHELVLRCRSLNMYNKAMPIRTHQNLQAQKSAEEGLLRVLDKLIHANVDLVNMLA